VAACSIRPWNKENQSAERVNGGADGGKTTPPRPVASSVETYGRARMAAVIGLSFVRSSPPTNAPVNRSSRTMGETMKRTGSFGSGETTRGTLLS
jgi:hypothetical protein